MRLCLYRASQDALHELALRLVISLPVATKFAGKLPFQKSKGIRLCWVCSKVIPERDMLVVFETAQRADIQVMLYIDTVRSEGLPPADAQIASVLVSQVGQLADHNCKVGR